MFVPPLPYEIDLDGPPARLRPRQPSWVLSVVSLFLAVVTAFVEVSLFQPGVSPSGRPVLLALVLLISITEVYVFWYLALRLTGGGLEPGVPILLAPFLFFRFRLATPGGRRADPEEILARRLLKRRAIPRAEYERIIAYRHFVHNEISLEEFHDILRFLGLPVPADSGRIEPRGMDADRSGR